MTYSEAIIFTAQEIKGHLVNPNDALELLCFVLEISREQFYIVPPSTRLTANQISMLKTIIGDYNQSKPLAYIIGRTEFLGNEIVVKPGVLIPRPETELLVQKFLDDIDEHSEINIVEIGTGSGCIIASVAKALKDKKLQFSITGLDPSPRAFEVTCLNIEQIIGVKLTRTQQDASYQDNNIRIKIINKPITEYDEDLCPTYIISNPPYITTAEMLMLDKSVHDFEPELALHGGSDGLDVYREIAEYVEVMNPKPKLHLEISPLIAANAEEVFQQVGYGTEVQLDQFDRARFLLCK